MLLLHPADVLNKAIWPVGHFRIVLAVGQLNVFASSLGGLPSVDCKLVEFGYKPFVLIEDVSRCHDSLLANCCWTPTRLERSVFT
jgi:hypothetical protein